MAHGDNAMMKTKLFLATRTLLACAALLSGASAFAQYTCEFVICLDGSSPDNCRNSALPIQNDGSVIWGRDLGTLLCAGAGIVPQDTDCTFLLYFFNGWDCVRIREAFSERVTAGVDMALACGDVAPLPNGDFSLLIAENSCFLDDRSLCQNFTLTDVTP